MNKKTVAGAVVLVVGLVGGAGFKVHSVRSKEATYWAENDKSKRGDERYLEWAEGWETRDSVFYEKFTPLAEHVAEASARSKGRDLDEAFAKGDMKTLRHVTSNHPREDEARRVVDEFRAKVVPAYAERARAKGVPADAIAVGEAALTALLEAEKATGHGSLMVGFEPIGDTSALPQRDMTFPTPTGDVVSDLSAWLKELSGGLLDATLGFVTDTQKEDSHVRLVFVPRAVVNSGRKIQVSRDGKPWGEVGLFEMSFEAHLKVPGRPAYAISLMSVPEPLSDWTEAANVAGKDPYFGFHQDLAQRCFRGMGGLFRSHVGW